MRKTPNVRAEQCRLEGPVNENNGLFLLKGTSGFNLFCQASDGELWDHVSVSVQDGDGPVERSPTWEEMCRVKELFFRDDEVIIQYHPRKTDYVDCHPFCLHLWRHQRVDFLTPDKFMVGIGAKSG